MLYAVAALRLHYESVNVDAVLRDLLMVAFMTTIGMGARLQLIRQGGARVIWFLGIASLGAAGVPGGADRGGVSDRLHEFADHYGIGDLDEVKRQFTAETPGTEQERGRHPAVRPSLVAS